MDYKWKGNFSKTVLISQPVKPTPLPPVVNNATAENRFEKQTDLFSSDIPIAENPVFENSENNFSNTQVSSVPKNEDKIDRIVIFYKNGVFKTYSPE